MTISVIIPTYNRADRVSRSIESVLAQTHAADEVVVVDDGSTDNTQSTLESYGSRINIIRQENAGVSEARNTGISAANSEWIAFLDDDDVFTPNRLSLAAESIRKNSDAIVHMSNLAVITNGTFDNDLFSIRGLQATEFMELERPLSWALRGCSFVQTLVVRKQSLVEAGLFKNMMHEDLDIIIRLCALGTWIVDPRTSVELSRRINEEQSITAEWRSKPIERFGALLKQFEHIKKSHDLNAEESRIVEDGIATNSFELGRAYYKAGRAKEGRDYFKTCSKYAPKKSTRLKSRLSLLLGPLGIAISDRLSSRRRLQFR